MTDPEQARNDTVDETTAEDRTTAEEGQLANPGPVPAEAEDSSDTGEEPGDLTAMAAPEKD